MGVVYVEVVMTQDWPYHITIETPNWWDAELWCLANIGNFDHDWYKLGIDPAEYVIDGRTRTTWYFKQEKHAMMFSLKWS